MPECKLCKRIAPTAELRKSNSTGYMCKTKWDCEQRQKEHNAKLDCRPPKNA